jgi:autoinducer 2-degrading protein
MVVLWIELHVKPENRTRFIEVAREKAQRASQEEGGVLGFDFLEDARDPNTFYYYEVYRDEDAFAAHRASDHFARWREAADTCLSAPLEATHAAMVVTRSDHG